VTSVGLTTATVRGLLGGKGESAGLVGSVAQQLGDAIRRGILLDGERLPAEPALAAQLGVSTVTLREALAALRQQGLVVTRRGRGGGTFVVSPDLSAELTSRLSELSCAGLRDLGDERAAVSGTAARLAAERALPSEIAAMRDQLDRFAAAVPAGDRRRAGTQLRLAIAAAGQSPRLVQAELQFAAEVGDLLWLRTTDEEHAAFTADHAELIDAIAVRDPARARAVAERRVTTETARLLALRLRAYPATGTLEQVGAELEDLLARLERLAAEFAALGAPRRDDLDDLRPSIFAILADHGDLATGAGVITAPDVLADAPLWLEWWWTSASGAPERLRVNLDPQAPDFYDYTTAPWYVAARGSGTSQAVGPYVDHFCTGDYTITLSVPAYTSGRFVGIAAADVLVASLERQIVPALGTGGQALTSAEGRVIASTSAELPAGSPAPVGDKSLLGWRLARVAGKAGNSPLRPPG
jgi:DNA-binding FadR family transcriptional regulator